VEPLLLLVQDRRHEIWLFSPLVLAVMSLFTAAVLKEISYYLNGINLLVGVFRCEQQPRRRRRWTPNVG
jgi:hypothetical protein